ncbi:hypothetical protein KDU71_09385 [Carboxylicivirga sediminis]|uniref:Uncharacterized protein n=1 Tax=Carboxylicivirga sediminis TaxID=2006564 RepID=A0A941IYG1_9BACT|nr:hypothetical protein [Carboxylicivirga sediminis]MBR8535767.1 hypothetical protein [Carboxylicivirga sediminis]
MRHAPATNTIHTHPAAFLMRQWQSFLSGLDRILTFYESDKQVEGLEWHQQMHGIITPLNIGDEARQKLKNISREKISHQWLRPELLPFVSQDTLKLNQLDLFSESHYLVLLVRTRSRETTILSYLFFRNDCSNFGISGNQSKLETSHKAIIGQMASQFASITLGNYYSVREESESFKEATRSLLNANQLDNTKQSESLKEWKNNWLDTYLLESSRRDGVNYVISVQARDKLLSGEHTYEVCKVAIDNCIDYICKLYNPATGDELMIEASYIQLTQQSAHQQVSKTFLASNQQNRAMLILDRLEDAATYLQQQGQSITSADVGATMQKPISAPAISDALRKNRVRILQLLEQYPERWPIIRRYFKPIINLRNKNNQFLSASG